MAEDARFIAPGRPATVLKLQDTPTLSIPETWSAIRLSTGPVTRLSVALVPAILVERNLVAMVVQMGTVRHLELVSALEASFEPVGHISELDLQLSPLEDG